MTALKEEQKRKKAPARPAPLENFVSFITDTGETTRVCSEAGCENAARRTKGYYLAGTRRVRVWVCVEHYVGNPNTVLPTPPDIQAAFDAEKKYREDRARWARMDVPPERGVSVKTMASTGFGKQIGFDRVANFRWEPAPGALAKKKGKRHA